MTEKVTIIGTIIFENIGTGVWAIQDESGSIWTPINIPAQLKQRGQRVRAVVQQTEAATIFMFGTPIKLLSFELI